MVRFFSKNRSLVHLMSIKNGKDQILVLNIFEKKNVMSLIITLVHRIDDVVDNINVELEKNHIH